MDDNRLFMNYGLYEQNIGEQKTNADGKVTEAANYRATFERLGASWRSDDFRGASEAVRQYETRAGDNAMIQTTLSQRGAAVLADGMDTGKFAQTAVQGLMGSA